MRLDRLYGLPWTEEDNPNGWIEPTTYCNLKCPGCYRGCDKEDYNAEHMPLEEIISQVDWMMEHRNIHTLSIAGGEPLLYPYLEELVEHASSRGLRIMIYTNGLLLDERLLHRLNNLGVTKFLIHIDEFQGIKGVKNLKDTISLREKFCEMFRHEVGSGLGFILPLNTTNIEELSPLINFFTNNRDIISLVVFTLYREICWDHREKPQIDTSLDMFKAIDILEKTGTFKPSSYLPATINKKEPAWIFSYSIGNKDSVYGNISPGAYQKIQERYRKNRGRYMFISRNNRVRLKGLLGFVFFRGMTKVLYKSLVKRSSLYHQTYLVIRGPVHVGKTWDLCEGCPDAMLYKNKLQPSCILEDIKKDPH